MKVRIFQDPKEKKRRGPKSCPWSVEWRENGRRRSKTIGTKADAEDFKTVKAAELLDKATGVTTTKLWSEFLDEYDKLVVEGFRSEASKTMTRQILRLFTDLARPRYVHPISRHDLDEYVAKRLAMPSRRKGDTIAAETVKKELRTIRAALNRARAWNHIKAVPSLPKVLGFKRDKGFMLETDFDAIMRACESATLPDPRIHDGIDPAAWWRALLAVLWTSGIRIQAALALRWDGADLDAGVVRSLARDNKGKRDMSHDVTAAVPFLNAIQSADPRLLPWNHDRRTLDVIFHRIQRAAGVHLDCPQEHEHTPACHVYGFHDLRRAHATYNYGKVDDRALQAQMGHASFSTTQGYIKYAKLHKREVYPAHLPDSLQPVENDGKTAGANSGKPQLRVVSA